MVDPTAEKKPVQPTPPRLRRPSLSSMRGQGRLLPLAVRQVRGRFDSATTTPDNRRHWANADALSADAAASVAVRQTLRNRARYEVANNSYAKGIVLTLANDTVGTGPRLQMLSDDDHANRTVEREFEFWTREVGLAEKLRTMRVSRCQDGESFSVMANNPVLEHPVKLDLRQIEADQVASPMGRTFEEAEVDGIHLDRYGNPVAYDVLKSHPGGNAWRLPDDFVTVPASHMIHVFRQDRPGLWSFVPLQNRLVRGRNFPPFYAFEDPSFYFEPPIKWQRDTPPPPVAEIASNVLFVPGAIESKGNQALHIAGKRFFTFSAGKPDPSGDGGQFLPRRQGTIEFFLKPDRGTTDLNGRAYRAYWARVLTEKGAWSLAYRIDPKGVSENLAPHEPSHSLHGFMRLDNNARLRVWRTETLFERGEWVHIAWSWGPEVVFGPHREKLSLMTMRVFVNGRGKRRVIFRSAVGKLARGVPKSLLVTQLGGAIDELRVSDVQRYQSDFTPPSRLKELPLDQSTRALFHFNGDLKGFGRDRRPVEGKVRN